MDYLYGYSDGLGWTCQDWKTGAVVWNEKSKLGKGAIGYADGHFYLLDEGSGSVVLIDASHEGWHETGRFKLDPQTTIRSPQGPHLDASGDLQRPALSARPGSYLLLRGEVGALRGYRRASCASFFAN
jgi:hypothetical protein